VGIGDGFWMDRSFRRRIFCGRVLDHRLVRPMGKKERGQIGKMGADRRSVFLFPRST